MFSRGRTEYDHSEEMTADASSSPPPVPLPPSDHTSEVDHSESAVAVSGSRQLPATTSELTDLAALMKLVIAKNDLATLNHLLDRGVDPNTRCQGRYTLLYWALIYGKREDVVKTLLDRGANPNLPACHFPPLLLAAMKADDKAVFLLLERGADLNARDHSNSSALHLATVCCNNPTAITEIMNCLLDRGADISALDCDGQTPLLWAVMSGNIAGINTLLQRGANPDTPDKWGQTALIKAVLYSVPAKINSMVNSLLANGANPNKPGKSGETPLHLALQKDRRDTVDILLANGARANIPNASGQTALDIAAAKGVADALHNIMPPYQPETLLACARTSIRSRLVKNQMPLAKALAPGSDCLPLSNPIRAYLHEPLTL